MKQRNSAAVRSFLLLLNFELLLRAMPAESPLRGENFELLELTFNSKL